MDTKKNNSIKEGILSSTPTYWSLYTTNTNIIGEWNLISINNGAVGLPTDRIIVGPAAKTFGNYFVYPITSKDGTPVYIGTKTISGLSMPNATTMYACYGTPTVIGNDCTNRLVMTVSPYVKPCTFTSSDSACSATVCDTSGTFTRTYTANNSPCV